MPLTPMFRVMVWPSLNPRSSLGPGSPLWAFLLSSSSCFSPLQVGSEHQGSVEEPWFYKPHRQCNVMMRGVPHVLELVLQRHVEVEGVAAIPEPHPDEGTATCRRPHSIDSYH